MSKNTTPMQQRRERLLDAYKKRVLAQQICDKGTSSNEHPEPMTDHATIDKANNKNHSLKHKKDESCIRMLEFVIESSELLRATINESEKIKSQWRSRFMWGSVILFGATLLAAVIVIILYSVDVICDFPLEIMIGLFGTIIVQIVSLIVLFVNFVNDVQYIKMFKAVTHKLLEYLSKDKQDDENESLPDE